MRSARILLIFGLAVAAPPRLSAARTPAEDAADEAEDAERVHRVEQVVVTGSRTEQRQADAAVSTQVITREDIERAGSETLAEILQGQPGLQLSWGFQPGPSARIQGLGSKYILVLLDGERTLGRIDGELDLSRFNAEDIERVEIVRGASSALYGSEALGGVINVISRRCKGGGLRGEARAEYGSMNAVNTTAMAGYCNDRLNFRVTGGLHHRDAYDLREEDPFTNGSAYDEYNVDSKLRYRLTDALQITTKAGYTYRDLAGVDAGRGAKAIFDRKNRTESFSASITPEYRVTSAAKLKATAHYANYKDQYLHDQRGSAALDTLHVTKEQVAELNLQYDHLISRHMLTVGVDSLYEDLKTPRLNRAKGSRTRVAPFLQDEWSLLDAPLLMLVPGFRVDLDSHFGAHATPKLTLRFDPVEVLALRASYGWGYRAPDFKEMYMHFENPAVGYMVEGNPDLKPETSKSFNLSAELSLGQAVSLSVNLFRNDLRNMISYEEIRLTGLPPGAAITRKYVNANIAKARTQGVESMLRVELYEASEVERLTMELGYTYLDATDKDGDPLIARAKHNIKAALTYEHLRAGFELTIRGSHLSHQPFFVQQGSGYKIVYSEALTKIDLRAAQDIYNKYLTVYAGVDNVLDDGDNNSQPMVPRSYHAGMISKF